MTATITPIAPTQLGFTVGASTLKSALATLKDALVSNGSLPVLRTVRLAADGWYVTASTSNLDLTLTVVLDDATCTDFGAVNVDYALLVKLLSDVKKASDEAVIIECVDGEAIVSLGDSEATLRTNLTEEWPRFSDLKPTASHEINVGQLVEVAAVAATDVSRPILTGTYLHNVAGTSTIVATDSYRLHAIRNLAPIAGLPEGSGMLLQSNVIKVLAKTKATTATMSWDGTDPGRGTIRFIVGNLTITSRLIEGQFPNYAGLIPDGKTEGFEVDDPTAFSAAMKYLGKFAGAHPARIDAEPAGLVLKVVVQDEGTFTRRIGGRLTPKAFTGTVAVNTNFAEKILDGCAGPIVIATIDGFKPVVAVSPHPDGGERLRLLMPVRV